MFNSDSFAEFATSDECYSSINQVQDDDIYEDLCAFRRGSSQVHNLYPFMNPNV